MEFNLNKFLIEHKLTKRSRFNEDDNTGGMMKTDAEKIEMGDEDDEVFGDEPEDNWYKDDSGDTEEFEKEPTKKDVAEPAALSGIHKKQADLKSLEDKKDALLMQLKSGQLGLDQYKATIGNIPAQIKKLRLDIDKALNMTGDEEELPA
jgi:hypothetical protein